MTKIKVLHDSDGAKIVPVTTSTAVKDEQGRSLYDAMAAKLSVVASGDLAPNAITSEKIGTVPGNALETWTELYSNSAGSTGDITLSDTIANYDKIVVCGTINGNLFCQQVRNYRAPSIEHRLGWLQQYSSTETYCYSQILSFSGNTMTRGYGAIVYYKTSVTFTSYNQQFPITKIYGVKTV